MSFPAPRSNLEVKIQLGSVRTCSILYLVEPFEKVVGGIILLPLFVIPLILSYVRF